MSQIHLPSLRLEDRVPATVLVRVHKIKGYKGTARDLSLGSKGEIERARYVQTDSELDANCRADGNEVRHLLSSECFSATGFLKAYRETIYPDLKDAGMMSIPT